MVKFKNFFKEAETLRNRHSRPFASMQYTRHDTVVEKIFCQRKFPVFLVRDAQPQMSWIIVALGNWGNEKTGRQWFPVD